MYIQGNVVHCRCLSGDWTEMRGEASERPTNEVSSTSCSILSEWMTDYSPRAEERDNLLTCFASSMWTSEIVQRDHKTSGQRWRLQLETSAARWTMLDNNTRKECRAIPTMNTCGELLMEVRSEYTCRVGNINCSEYFTWRCGAKNVELVVTRWPNGKIAQPQYYLQWLRLREE